jgi:hypothetical protein
MKNKVVGSDYINNIIFIVLLLVIVLIVCFKSLTIHKNIMENFESETNKMEKEMDNAMGSNNDDSSMTDDLNEMMNDLGSIYNKGSDDDALDNVDEEELVKKCATIDKASFGSITSKYSGKTINVDALPPVKGAKRKYMIKWQPVGGKPGGCITANADGTYSTPICNTNINKQQWFITEVKNDDQYLKLIPKDRRRMGGSMDETDFPFHICQSVEYENYCLHYEGGGLAIREIANYNAQKWDVSKDKIAQDPLPTQDGNKYAGLTPGHKLSQEDKSLGSVGESGGANGGGGATPQFNINVDPDLLAKLGIDTGLSSLNNTQSSNNNRGKGDLLMSEQEIEERRRRNNTDDMMVDYNGNRELCENCGDIPENMIRKDLVKSMCIGCNNIDNVLT